MASPFSGRAGRNASIWAAGYLEKQQDKINDLIALGEAKQIGAIDQGQLSSLANIDSGFKGARNLYRSARQMYDPYAQMGKTALGQLSDASGLNGAEGYDRATAAFRESPGYQYRVDQALDQVNRAQSATGALASGNTLAALQDRAANEADQEYGTYYDRLSGLTQLGYDATGKQAGITAGIGDLWNQRGTAKASLYDDNAENRANIFGNSTSLGVNTTANTAGSIAELGYKGMMAGQEAAATRMNFGLQGLGTILKLASLPMSGGGSLGGNLFG